mgnify:CR=1 FL=1
MNDMNEKVFEDQPFGKAAMKEIKGATKNFRLFSASWVGDNPSKSKAMKVTGAEFRAAKSGPNKGQLSIMVKNTQQTVYVTKAEMLET